MGLGSDGFEIFGLRAPILERGSSGGGNVRPPDGPPLNHFAGLKRLPSPDGDGAREGNCCEPLGDGGTSPGLSIWGVPLRDGMNAAGRYGSRLGTKWARRVGAKRVCGESRPAPARIARTYPRADRFQRWPASGRTQPGGRTTQSTAGEVEVERTMQDREDAPHR
jgi:hypothetical protein